MGNQASLSAKVHDAVQKNDLVAFTVCDDQAGLGDRGWARKAARVRALLAAERSIVSRTAAHRGRLLWGCIAALQRTCVNPHLTCTARRSHFDKTSSPTPGPTMQFRIRLPATCTLLACPAWPLVPQALMNELGRLCPDDPAARAHVLEQRDMQGRTLLMQAAAKNDSQIMERVRHGRV